MSYAASTQSAEWDLESRLSLLSTSFMTPIGAGSKVHFLLISSGMSQASASH